MAWQVGDGRLVDTPSGIYIDRVDHLISRLCILFGLVLILVLPRWSQEQAPIGRERESSEERSQGLVGVEVGILHSQTSADG